MSEMPSKIRVQAVERATRLSAELPSTLNVDLKSLVPALRKFYNRRIIKKLWANQECMVVREEVYGVSCRC